MPFGTEASIKKGRGSITSRHAEERGGGGGLGCGERDPRLVSFLLGEGRAVCKMGRDRWGYFYRAVALGGLGNDEEILSGI